MLNLKKCLSDKTLVIPLDEIQIDDKPHFTKEPVEIIDQEVKQLKQSHIPIVKVRWNPKRGPEFTWESKDQFRAMYLRQIPQIKLQNKALFMRKYCENCFRISFEVGELMVALAKGLG
ncbi:hypothetical protein Tco_0991763 [Tanacetum coccineum]|uniref:Reverse transcriptase domain-containing protein n=1 Tax=Tanacetum coccineum TaxID=301880 RepID=A0ABQ5F0Y4_9ASTR